MMNNNSIKVQVKVIRIIGDTYPYRNILKQMHFVWNPNQKLWEKREPISDIDTEKIIKLGLKIQQSRIDEPMVIKITPIEALDENDHIKGCIGYVKELESVHSFIRNDGTSGYIQRFVLGDQSGCIKCVSWNLAGSNELKHDRIVTIQNAIVKASEEELEFHCSDHTKFWIVSEIPEYLSKNSVEKSYYKWVMDKIQPINKAHIGFHQKFQGMITDIQGIYNYEKNGRVQLMIILLLDDQTEVIKVSLFGDMCYELLALTTEEQNKITHMLPLERIDSSLVVEKINNLIGRKIIIKGTVEENDYTKLLELKANRFYPIQKSEEAL